VKILIVSPYFFEPHRWMISAYKTALYLSKHHQIVVLTTGRPRYEKLNKNLTIYRLPDIFIPDPLNLSYVPGLYYHLIRVVRREKPTHFIVNKNMYHTAFVIPLLRLWGKKVVTVTDTFPGVNWFPRNKNLRWVHWALARLLGMPFLKMSSHTVLLHEGLINDAKKFHLNYSVIHNGVDLAEVDAASLSLDLDQRYLNIIYVGRLESIKGYLDLVAVAQSITRKNPKVRFTFVGSYQGKEEWVKEVESKQIVFLGHRTDIFPLLKSAQIFVLASYAEGLPNALMEAMACSLPVVCSEVGGVKVLIENEKNGLLFPAGDRAQMEKQLERLIGDAKLGQKLGRAARKTIEKDFSWENIAKEYKKLLSSLETKQAAGSRCLKSNR
jgi:glycosyltransferase involved in cell wall biosynthesis